MCEISGSHCGSLGTLKMDIPNNSKMFAHIHHMARHTFQKTIILVVTSMRTSDIMNLDFMIIQGE